MGASISIIAYSSTESKEFQKHFKAVHFCLENGLSYPKETSEFFKGKIHGSDLEDYTKESVLKYIENGVQVELPIKRDDDNFYKKIIKVSDIPKEVDIIVVELSY